MGELKLFGMKAAFDEIMATAVKRQHEPQRIVGDLLNAEISEKQARSTHCYSGWNSDPRAGGSAAARKPAVQGVDDARPPPLPPPPPSVPHERMPSPSVSMVSQPVTVRLTVVCG